MRGYALVATAVPAVLILSVPVSAASGWTTPQRVWDAAYDQASMVVDGNGAVPIAAIGPNGIWYLTNESGRWTRARLTGADALVRAPRIARDPPMAA